MNRGRVQCNRDESDETTSRTSTAKFIFTDCTICNKYYMRAGHTTDSDNWLELGEQFERPLCLQEGIPAYGLFHFVFSPNGIAIPRYIPA